MPSQLDSMHALSYSTYLENKGAPLSASDVEHYVAIRKLLLKFIFNILSALIWWEIQAHKCRIFLHKVAYTRYDIPSFAEQMGFTTAQRPEKSIK